MRCEHCDKDGMHWDEYQHHDCKADLKIKQRIEELEAENQTLKEPLRFSISIPGDYQVKYRYEEHDGKQVLMKILERVR